MLITSLDYSNYTGRIAVGRVHRGVLKDGMNIIICHRDGSKEKTKIKELHTFNGIGHQRVDEVGSGDICAVIGLEKFEIGDTICDFENPEPLPPIAVDEPTMSMLFTINDSPFFGKEGKFCTSRHIQERLNKELEKNLALRVQPYEDSTDKWIVSGRVSAAAPNPGMRPPAPGCCRAGRGRSCVGAFLIGVMRGAGHGVIVNEN